MTKINVLSFEVANLIAAGEVVDRPASAVKELMENSIDAGARHITVEIQNGGITFMRVSDDGCGMEPEDLPLAVRRHATSKISTAEDLDGISTLGFRGEALAALSSVSDMRIISKTPENSIGAMLTVRCGEIEELREHGCSMGTTVIAEQLFANVPARRKFLKRDVTETTAVCANVEKVALSHPEISFKLICDGQVRLETAGDGQLKNAVYSVFGRDFANRLIEVNGEYDGIRIKGYIGRSDNVKGNRNYQNFYINNRFVKSKTASAALEQAFVSYLPSEKYPVCVLFIMLNPGRVDVNVHPAKLEVKFSNEKPIFEAIYYSVRQALEENTARPEMTVGASRGMRMSDAFAPVERGESLKARQVTMDIGGRAPQTDTSIPRSTNAKESARASEIFSREPAPQIKITAKEYLEQYVSADRDNIESSVAQNQIPKKDNEKSISEEIKFPSAKDSENSVAEALKVSYDKESKRLDCDDNTSKPSVTSDKDVKRDERTARTPLPEKQPEVQRYLPSLRYVGEVFNSYLIVECGEKMLIVDKHAAHERIIFEQLKANMRASDCYSQLLMLPLEVMLMTDEVAAIDEYRSEIEAVGFEISASKNTVTVSAIPSGIEPEAVADMLAVIADRIKNGTGSAGLTRDIIFEKALYQGSCKAAIKAGREYPEEYNRWLVEKLSQIPDITFCPHGRPVAMEMSKKNMDRQFERT